MADTVLLTLTAVLLAVVLGGAILLWMLSSGQKRTASGAKIPDGSMGWPIVGETLAFAKDRDAYTVSHIKKYGRLFKSSLFLKRAIVGTTADFAKFVLGGGNGFVSGWPPNIMKVIGERGFAFNDGPAALALKRFLQKPVLPEGLKDQVAQLEAIILRHLLSWAEQGDVVTAPVSKDLTMDLSMHVIIGVGNMEATEEGKLPKTYFGLMALAIKTPPVDLPGTTFRRGLKAKANLNTYFKTLLEKRRREENTQSDCLGALLAAQEDSCAREEVKNLDDDTICDNLVGMWFAAYNTTSTSFLWTLKLLFEHPEVFRLVQAEQLEILKSKESARPGKPRLTWEDLKKMVYSTKVVHEVQRYTSLASMLFRKAAYDLDYNGNLVPKGWLAAPLPKAVHYDPANYSDPLTFDPAHFDTAPKPFSYLAFSSGPRMCPGMEFAKTLLLIFIHHMATSFNCESTAPDQGVEYKNLVTPIGGYPINISLRK